MVLRDRVQLPGPTRRIGGLLDAARPMRDVEGASEWWRGVTFTGNRCLDAILHSPCEEDFSTALDVPNNLPEPVSFVPTMVRMGIACTALSGIDVGGLSTTVVDAVVEWVAGHVLQTGDHTEYTLDGGTVTNPALVDATDLVGGGLITTVPDALGCLEQYAADNIIGQAFIHVPPGLAPHMLGAPGIWRDGDTWRTATGNPVVISPGYSGTDMYVTSEVFTAVGEPSRPQTDAETVDRTDNTLTAWADQLVLSIFDPCAMARVGVDVELCNATT